MAEAGPGPGDAAVAPTEPAAGAGPGASPSGDSTPFRAIAAAFRGALRQLTPRRLIARLIGAGGPLPDSEGATAAGPAGPPAPSAEPAAVVAAGPAAASESEKLALEKLEKELGPRFPSGFDGFTDAIAFTQQRATENGFAIIIKAGSGSANVDVRDLESRPQDDTEGLRNAYGRLLMLCSRAGEATSEGTGQRASGTGRKGCRFKIVMSRKKNRSGDQPGPVRVSLTSSLFEHNDHVKLKPEQARLLKQARFIPDALQASLRRLATTPGLTEGSVHRLLMQEAQQAEPRLDVTWTLEDVRQVLYETRGNHATGDAQRAVDLLRRLAADGHVKYDIKLGANGQLTRVVWQTESQVRA